MILVKTSLIESKLVFSKKTAYFQTATNYMVTHKSNSIEGI